MITKDEIKQIAARGYEDPVFFCRYFLPHLFSRPVPWVHRGIMSILTKQTGFLHTYGELDKIFSNFVRQEVPGDPKSPLVSIFHMEDDGTISLTLGAYTMLMLPRGYSKTTLAAVAMDLWDISYLVSPFAVIVSETSAHAKRTIGSTRRELESNDRHQAIFGTLQPDMKDPEKWSEEFFETTTGIARAALGRGGQIRGMHHRNQRPVKIICDDLEDKESVSTDAQLLKAREWAYGDLMPALPKMDPNAGIVAMGTLLHREALLMQWSKDPEWTVIRFGAYDRQGDLLWPDNMDEAKLEATKVSMATAGMLHVYYMEYFNEAVAPELQRFKPEFIRHGSVDNLTHTAVYVDPAISEKPGADETAIYVAGINDKGTIAVLDEISGRGMSPRDTIDGYFKLSKRWNCDQHGVESIAYQAALIHLMREEMFRRKHYFEITPVTHKVKKAERILGILQPRYANGYVVHTRSFPKLEAQLLDFGGGRGHDDHPDALAGCIALLDPYAAQAAGDQDLGEDEYPPLDEVFGGTAWRG